jgi:arabinan endo-1,5-alpha-L-arabinosidase
VRSPPLCPGQIAYLGSVSGSLRHILRLLAALAAFALLPAGAAAAWTLRYHDPLRSPTSGRPFSCPDPSVTDSPQPGGGYILVCTSGYSKNAFPIYTSHDLVHWLPDGFVFPHGHQPWWAVPSAAHGPQGRYWAPELYRIEGRWVVYFAAVYNAAKIDLPVPGSGRLTPRTMVVGVAWANSLRGPWHSSVLHYRGQFNNVSAEPESPGPAIDPSVVADPSTGQLYLFWSDQSTEIWAGALSADGTKLDGPISLVLRTSEPFECDPSDHHCTIEAPEPFVNDGIFYLLYSGGSTWDASYDVGVAAAYAPLGPYVKRPTPILEQGGGFYSTGHTSHPIIGPDGNTYILYHARTTPAHSNLSSRRYLMLGRLGWSEGWPTISP